MSDGAVCEPPRAKENEMVVGNHTMWAVADDTYIPCETTTPSLPPGQYLIEHSAQRGIFFNRNQLTLMTYYVCQIIA